MNVFPIQVLVRIQMFFYLYCSNKQRQISFILVTADFRKYFTSKTTQCIIVLLLLNFLKLKFQSQRKMH